MSFFHTEVVELDTHTLFFQKIYVCTHIHAEYDKMFHINSDQVNGKKHCRRAWFLAIRMAIRERVEVVGTLR